MKRNLRHLPNALTVLRLVAAPATAALLLYDHYGAAFAIFLFAGISDLVDGYLAKRYGLATRLGRYLDPAADKALMFTCFLVLALQQIVPVWLAAIVIGRDVIMIAAVGAAKLMNVPLTVMPLPIGKLTAVLQVAFVGVQLFVLAFEIDIGELQRWLALVVAMVTVASAFVYSSLWLRAVMRAGKASRGHGN